MKIDYEVLHASDHANLATVQHQGEDIIAPVPGLTIDLVPVDGTTGHGTFTLKFSKPSEIAEAKKTFLPGRTITLTFDALSDDELATHIARLKEAQEAAMKAAEAPSKPEASITTKEA